MISASLNFGSTGSRGGNAGGCFSLGGVPNAAHINMIAVNPTGKGNLQAFPVGAGTGVGLSVNYNKIRTNLANASTVQKDTGTGQDICVASNFSSVQTVIDILGYTTIQRHKIIELKDGVFYFAALFPNECMC